MIELSSFYCLQTHFTIIQTNFYPSLSTYFDIEWKFVWITFNRWLWAYCRLSKEEYTENGYTFEWKSRTKSARICLFAWKVTFCTKNHMVNHTLWRRFKWANVFHPEVFIWNFVYSMQWNIKQCEWHWFHLYSNKLSWAFQFFTLNFELKQTVCSRLIYIFYNYMLIGTV